MRINHTRSFYRTLLHILDDLYINKHNHNRRLHHFCRSSIESTADLNTLVSKWNVFVISLERSTAVDLSVKPYATTYSFVSSYNAVTQNHDLL